jgi:hypothetical protein
MYRVLFACRAAWVLVDYRLAPLAIQVCGASLESGKARQLGNLASGAMSMEWASDAKRPGQDSAGAAGGHG